MVLLAGCSNKKASSALSTTTTVSTTTSTSVASNSPYCTLARQFTQTFTANALANPTTAFQQFDALSTQFLAVVPSAIKADAETAIAAVKQVEASFHAVGDVITKLTPADLEPVESPNFTAATNAIVAYDTKVCGIAPITTSTT
jgi:hypothetical protein